MKHLVLFGLFVCFCGVLADESVVNTESGPVKGVVADSYRVFKSIPYIAPPTGDLRLAPPQPPKSWGPNPRDCTKYGAGCPQNCKLPPMTCPDTQDEDCITLNVWTPRADKLKTPQPVMVFLPGGHFEQGTAGCDLYDGSYIVNRSNVILVTINYRLGVLGWVVVPGLNGNLGFLDQRAALQWVQKNIANFGGDPNQVTLFGQSAGAASAVAHLMSPLSKGLFQRCIVESDPVTLPMRPVDDAIKLGNKILELLNCPTDNTALQCMRSKSIPEILAAQEEGEKMIDYFHILETFLPWTVTIDGVEITEQALKAFASGNFTDIPTIMGQVSEEAFMFIYMADNNSVSTAEYLAVVEYIFLYEAPRVVYRYPPTPAIGDKRPALGGLGTDYIFICPLRNLMSNFAKNSKNSVYVYDYEHVMSFNAWGPRYQYCVGHVCHGSELPILFHSAHFGGFKPTPAEEELSGLMVDFWTNFARSGDPNTPVVTSVKWPKFDSALNYMAFNAPGSQAKSNLKADQCNMFDYIGYDWGVNLGGMGRPKMKSSTLNTPITIAN